MAKDKPSFLQNIGDDEEEKDILSVLENDAPETPVVEETPKEEESKDEKPEEETKKEDEEKKEPNFLSEKKEVEPKEKKGKEKEVVEKPKVKAKGKIEVKPEVKPEEQKPLILGKYKTTEELEKAHLELQRTFTKLSEDAKKGVIEAKGKDELDMFRKTPVIQAKIPDPSHYYFKNDKGEDVLDLSSYMKDTLNSFAISVQQNLLGGPLASAVFTMLGKAVTEEQGSAIKERQRDENSAKIWDNIQTSYPIMKTNEKLQSLFERAIYGEKHRRMMVAQQNKTAPVEMTEEDYLALAQELVGLQVTSTGEVVEEPTEKVKGDATLTESGTGLSGVEREIDQNISDMVGLKNKQLF